MYLDTYLGSDTYSPTPPTLKRRLWKEVVWPPSAESNVVPGSLKIMTHIPLNLNQHEGAGLSFFFYHGLFLDWVGPEMACSPHTDHH